MRNWRHFRLSRYAALLWAPCTVISDVADAQGTMLMPLDPPRSQARAEQQAPATPQTRAGGFLRVPDLPFPKGPWAARQAPVPVQRLARLEARVTAGGAGR